MVGKEKYSMNRGKVGVGYSIDDWETGQDPASRRWAVTGRKARLKGFRLWWAK